VQLKSQLTRKIIDNEPDSSAEHRRCV